MKFRCKKIAPRVLRPVIPIELQHQGNSVRYEVLVDSGADICMVPAELGELLGISLRKGKKGIVGGITGGGQEYFVHEITIRVGGWAQSVEIGFMPSMPPVGYGVVGQKGFFDLWKVIFDGRRGEVEIKPYAS